MTDDFKNEQPRQKSFHVSLDVDSKEPLHALAIRFGYLRTVYGRIARKKRGHVSALITAIGKGEHQISPKLAHPENIKIINQIINFIKSKQAFKVEVEQPENNIYLDCLAGKIIFDLNGKYILIAYTDTENPKEVSELSRNHSLAIDRILSVTYSTSSYSKQMPLLRMKFLIKEKSSYNPNPDGISSKEGIDRSGLIIVRDVFSSQNLIKEFLYYVETLVFFAF